MNTIQQTQQSEKLATHENNGNEKDSFSAESQFHQIVSSLESRISQAENTIVGFGLPATPQRILAEVLRLQHDLLNSHDIEDYKLNEYASAHTLLAVLSSFSAAPSLYALEGNKVMSRPEIRRHKKVAATFTTDLHVGMLYAQGEMADKYTELFQILSSVLAQKIGLGEENRMTRGDIEACIRGISHEVAVHRALAYPSRIGDRDYQVRASTPKEDLNGADIIIESGHARIDIDVKTRGSFLAKLKDIGYGKNSSLKLGLLMLSKKDNEMKLLLNATALGDMRGFDFSPHAQASLRRRIGAKLEEVLT